MMLYGMLYAVGVGLPLLLAALLSSALLRRHGRTERGVWLGALVLALALPISALSRPRAEPPAALEPATEVAATRSIGLPATVVVPDISRVVVPGARAALGLDELLVGLWLLVSLVLAVRWAVAARRLTRVTRSCPSATVDGVRVWLTTDLGPAVAGCLRPRILVPSWLMSLPAEQRSLVLLHEEEHLRARDPILFAVSRLSRILAPWNPVVWLVTARLQRAIELDCDRRVLRRRPDVRAYGTTLLTVSGRDPGALVGAAAFSEIDAPLRRRILAMTTPPGTVSVVGLVTALVLGILLLLGALEVPVPTVGPTAPEAATERIAELEARVRELEASNARATRRASAAEALMESLDRSGRVAHSGTIAGTVRDAVTGRPIEHVQVFLRDIGIGSLTNAAGRYLLAGVPAGESEVVAQLIGYAEVGRTLTLDEGASLDVDFQLQEAAVELEGVVVAGEGPEGSIRLPGVRTGPDGAGPIIFVDGVRVDRSEGSVLDELRPEQIERIEIVKADAAVALFGAEARAGVIQIFLKKPEDARPTRRNPSGGPVFTPFTVAPRVLNRDEVLEAMRRAYPPELRADGIGGTVMVYFFITEDGTVQDYRLDESSGYPALDGAALEVADVYRFSPALNRDQRVPVWVAFPITFLTGG